MALKIVLGICALLAFVLVISALQAWRNGAAALRDYPATGQMIEIDGHSVHAVQMGQGPDIILIHGAAANGRDMSFALGPALANRYRVTIFDRPGLGHTPAIDPSGDSIDAQARLLAKAADKLGVSTPIVLGQSYGGAVALAWALGRPNGLRGLVIVAGASNPWDTPLPGLYRAVTHPLFGGVARLMLAAWVSDGYVARSVTAAFAPQSPPAGYADHLGIPLTLRTSALRANGQQRAQLLDQIVAQVPLYPTLDLPVEIIHGDADKTVSLEIHSKPLARQIPDANLTVLPGIGHMPHLVAQDDVIAAIDRAADRAGLR